MQTFESKALEQDYLKIVRFSWLITTLLMASGPTILFSAIFELKWYFSVLTYLASYLLLYGLIHWYTIHWFKAYRYSLTGAGLKIHKGVIWQQQNMVPRNRVQHVDITTGPLERRYDLGKLVVHTAGTRNATITLPGLLQQHAADLRQELINTNSSEDTV